ncbi:MAG: glycosyltransferase, partial [Cyclobacteriaceae bacterium]
MEILLITLLFFLCLGHATALLTKALRVKKYEADYQKNQPTVTVLVSAHNERENLVALIPLLLAQDYSDVEIIVALDRSDDGSENLKEVFISEKLRFIEIMEVPAGMHPKKFAIQK